MAKLWLTYAWKDNQDQDVDHLVGELKRVGLDVAFDRACVFVVAAAAMLIEPVAAAKLKGARDRKRRISGKCEGRKSYAERDPELVDMARWLHHNADRRPYSLRQVAAELAGYGYMTPSGRWTVPRGIHTKLPAIVCSPNFSVSSPSMT